MNSKLATVLMAYCLIHFFSGAEGSFIKPNNVPRVGRSNEGSPFDQGSFGYVIKSNKNIPRMGRRNYDSVNQGYRKLTVEHLGEPLWCTTGQKPHSKFESRKKKRIAEAIQCYEACDAILCFNEHDSGRACVSITVAPDCYTIKENRYDIPKFYQLPSDNFDVYEGEQLEYNMPMEAFYSKQPGNMKR